MKTCFKCGQSQPASNFYKHHRMKDGLLGKCKACTKRDVAQNRDAKLDKVRAYDRARGSRKTAAQQRAYRLENQEKLKAQRKVRYALSRGYLIKKPCEKCGAPNAHAHHDDYSAALEVWWLCAKHHAQHHKGREID